MRRKFDGVGDEVVHYLLQFLAIAPDPVRVTTVMLLQRNPFFLRQQAVQPDHLINKGNNLLNLFLQGQLAHFYNRNIKQLYNQMVHESAQGANIGEDFNHFQRQGAFIVKKHVRICDDRGYRVAQVMGSHAQKLVLHVIKLLQFNIFFLKLAGEVSQRMVKVKY